MVIGIEKGEEFSNLEGEIYGCATWLWGGPCLARRFLIVLMINIKSCLLGLRDG